MAVAFMEEAILKEFGPLHCDNKDLTDHAAQSEKYLKLLRDTTLDIAITGGSGAGKSSLVNALRGMTDDEEGSAEVGDTETTMEPKRYPHPTSPKTTVWDLPGIGTPQFNAKKYLKKVGFKQYDFFIIVASSRFTENDVLLAREIREMQKKFYYVRTKIDQSINAGRRKAGFSEEKCLKRIRDYCCDNLTKAGESNPRVFLVSNWALNMYDFPLLQETLEKDLDNLKRHTLILAMPAFSKEDLKKKKAAMKSLILKVALVSCAIGAIPVPGLSLVCDTVILVSTMRHFCKGFGLDEDSLHRLANRVNKPVDVLRSAVKKPLLVHNITTESVTALLYELAMGKKLLPAKVALGSGSSALRVVEIAHDFVPMFCSLAGGAISLVTTFFILKDFLDDVEEDAENVQAKAMESHVDN